MNKVKTFIRQNKVANWIRRHKRISIVIGVVLIALIFIFQPKSPPELETATVKEGKISEVLSATGTVEAESLVNLSFLAGGKVTYIGAQEGDEVTAGQTIATLDQRTAQKNLQNALSDYAKQRNTFEDTKDKNNDKTPETAPNEEIRRILENNQYDLNKAVTSVELQELARESSVLTSPISGILIHSDIKVAGVNAAPTNMFTVADPEALIFQIEIDGADIGKVKLGQPVKITLDAFPEAPLSATVTGIDFSSHKTDTGGNSFYVDVALPLGSLDYRLGMGGDAEILLAEKNQTTIVPIAALEDDRAVYVKTEKGYEKRGVRVGLMSDTEAEIITGLKKGEIVSLQPEEAAQQVVGAKK